MSADKYASAGDTRELLQSSKQPLALHLATALEKTMVWPLHGKAADELRRLSAKCDELLAALIERELTTRRENLLAAAESPQARSFFEPVSCADELRRLSAERDDLLAALREARDALQTANTVSSWADGKATRFDGDIAAIDAAIAKTTGVTP